MAWDAATLIAGRACRDALARVCAWHKQLSPGLKCETVPPGAPQKSVRDPG